jgi:hypothetical protein
LTATLVWSNEHGYPPPFNVCGCNPCDCPTIVVPLTYTPSLTHAPAYPGWAGSTSTGLNIEFFCEGIGGPPWRIYGWCGTDFGESGFDVTEYGPISCSPFVVQFGIATVGVFSRCMPCSCLLSFNCGCTIIATVTE